MAHCVEGGGLKGDPHSVVPPPKNVSCTRRTKTAGTGQGPRLKGLLSALPNTGGVGGSPEMHHLPVLYAVGMAEYTSPCGGKLGVVTDTTGVARGCVDWELLNRWVLCRWSTEG